MALRIEKVRPDHIDEYATREEFHEDYAGVAMDGLDDPTRYDAVLIKRDAENGLVTFVATTGYWCDELEPGETEVRKLRVYEVEFSHWTNEPLGHLAHLANFAAIDAELGYRGANYAEEFVKIYEAACDAWIEDLSPDDPIRQNHRYYRLLDRE